MSQQPLKYLRKPMTQERVDVFLEALRRGETISEAARQATPHSNDRHAGGSTFRKKIKDDPEFNTLVEQAQEEGSSFYSAMLNGRKVIAEDPALRRALAASRVSSDRPDPIRKASERRRARDARISAGKNLHIPENHRTVANHMVSSARRNVKKTGHEHSIVAEDLIPLPTHCPIFGIKLTYGGTGYPVASSASIDRVDNSKGYIPGNVQVISNRANSLKRDATISDVENLLAYMKECS